MKNDLSPWLTVEQAAAYLSLSRKALYQAVRRGQLPVHRLGKRLRFRRDEIDRALSRTAPCAVDACSERMEP
jgi:excisionase family DNA binding protein